MVRRPLHATLRGSAAIVVVLGVFFGTTSAHAIEATATARATAPAPAAVKPAAGPKSLMPCSPPRPTFSGGTGAFHSDHFLSDYVTAPTLDAADVPNANFTN